MIKVKNCGNCLYTPRDFHNKRKPCKPCWANPRYNLWKPLYNQKQLKIGTKIELEHTRNIKVADKIAKDHLNEYPDYYTHLVKLEKKLSKKNYRRY